jgi:purine-binding chemotaxis protein CheW
MNMTVAATPPTQRPAATAPRPWQAGGDFLSFRLGTQEYGIDIQRVREIRSYETPTRVAHLPPAMKGVVNLRGVIVPMIDLRLLLGCGRCDYDTLTAVIMLDLGGRTVGAVVDSVCDVLALGPAMIQAPPQSAPAPARGTACGHVVGIGRFADRSLLLLDIGALMAHADAGMAALHG